MSSTDNPRSSPDRRTQPEGTPPKSELRVAPHPDVSRLMWRFGRSRHYVDYRPFKANAPVGKAGHEIAPGADEYGMTRYRAKR